MKALVVYESMFGNTHLIAEQVGEGLKPEFDTTVVPVADATPELVAAADFLVVGGPTHVHGLPGPRTRNAAKETAAKPESGVVLEPHATDPGVREWLKAIAVRPGVAAATFDTRMKGPALFTGRASEGIARRLRGAGAKVLATQSFFVDKHEHLLDGEAGRARTWAAALRVDVDVVSR